jgi:MYXO-CTERM domain-containing protein
VWRRLPDKDITPLRLLVRLPPAAAVAAALSWPRSRRTLLAALRLRSLPATEAVPTPMLTLTQLALPLLALLVLPLLRRRLQADQPGR